MNPPTVKATIVSESQAKALLKNDQGNNRAMSETSGEILNNSSIMEYHPQSGVLSVNFRNMSLRRIKRSDKRGAESVTEEKFTILFQVCYFFINMFSLFFSPNSLLEAMSLSFKFAHYHCPSWLLSMAIKKQMQRLQFCGTMHLLSRVAFPSKVNIHGFNCSLIVASDTVPDKVPWCRIIETLNYKWKHECQSHGLTTGAMSYLAQKLFRQALPPSSDKLVSWAQFNREPLANRNFTFWQWFNGVMELTKSKHCQPHWLDKGVVGFIGKAESQVRLFVWLNQ